MTQLKWWQEGVVYQVYPRSFQDTNGDGIGDLKGIIHRLDYLQALGVTILWLSPIYPSPNVDNGYDISDYRGIHPEFGTLEDMEALIEGAKRRGIRIVMDLVINHTSNAHPWFQMSRNQIEPYTDFYIWRSGKGQGLPNNWTGFFGDKCWTYDEKRGAYYLHLFAKEQPDLNYKNPKVLETIESMMGFWLKKGVKGFRCDVINVIDKSSLDDGKKKLVLTGSEHYLSQPGAYKIIAHLKKQVATFDGFLVGETVFVDTKQARALTTPKGDALDMLFAFEHLEADQWIVKWFKRKFHKRQFFNTLVKWQSQLEWNANYLENHDQLRCVSRFGDHGQYQERSAKMLATLLLTLRGTPFIYQGQEIGMTNFDFQDMDQIKDVESHRIDALLKQWHIPSFIRFYLIKRATRDHVRTPMQWTDGPQAGFTTNTPWLALNPNYEKVNCESQLNRSDSVWQYYKDMITLRQKMEALNAGTFEPLHVTNHYFIFSRTLNDQRLVVLLNFSKRKTKALYKGQVVITNVKREHYDGILEPYEGLILLETGQEEVI